jgi:kinesin family protein 3/17/kinesin family protein 11
VVGCIRNLTADASALDIIETSVRVRVPPHDARGGRPCLRDFALDSVSASEEEGLEAFYGRFVRSRVDGVRAGAKCTVMVYGPTGSGKSHTMFGCAEQPGIVYRALWDMLDGGGGGNSTIQVSFLEIYNEEVYDLLAGSGGGPKPKVIRLCFHTPWLHAIVLMCLPNTVSWVELGI